MATLKDVAQRSGVSLSTVSIVARGQGEARKISEATQERVREAMRELGYVPNAAARSLRGGAARQTLALFWADDYREPMLARFLGGLHAAIEKRGLEWDVAVVSYRAGRLSEVSSLAGAPTFDMAVVANAEAADLEFLASKPPLVPVVLYNRRLGGVGSVAVDDAEVGRLAARLVMESAAARGAGPADAGEALCLSSPSAFSGARAREEAFVAALAEAGIRSRRAVVPQVSADAGFDALSAPGALDGVSWVFAPGDNVAMGALHALHALGVEVPSQVGVVAVGTGVREYAEHSFPPLTCVEIPMEEMAAGCVDLLRARSDEERRAEPKVAGRASL